MAMLINLGKIIIMAMLHHENTVIPSFSPLRHRGQRAEDLIAQIFDADGWTVTHAPRNGLQEAYLAVSKRHRSFAVAIKSLSEGRADRVIPLLSHAVLQAQAYARMGKKALPLAVIHVERASPSLINHVISFSEQFAPDVAIGIIVDRGLQRFLGAGLEGLNAEPRDIRRGIAPPSNQAVHLFSDLNQWMLKVLLAPEIPENLLTAPRTPCRNASDLAVAAAVSKMSASRFIQQLRKEGFLEDFSQGLRLVRRAELFRRWRAAALRHSLEMPMRFLIRGSVKLQIREMMSSHKACLGLFAAATELKFGHVTGIPAHIYVPKLPRFDDDGWKGLVSASHSEAPDLILRQAASPNSVFRSAVNHQGMAVSDIIQVWLDVSDHPSRGQEQADLIYRKLLKKIIEGSV